MTSPVESEREWARQNIQGVRVYEDYNSMLEDDRIQAVVVSTITAVHADQSLAAIAKGYHVLCEKPLSLDLEIVSSTWCSFYILSLTRFLSYRRNPCSMPTTSPSKPTRTRKSCAPFRVDSMPRIEKHMTK